MPFFMELFRRLGSFLGLTHGNAELDDEIRFHLEMEAEKNRRLGMSDEVAKRAALRDFGNVTRTKEASRDQRGFPRLGDLLGDLRLAARSLRRAPGFAAVAIITLGLGVGATTAIFSVVEAVLLRPLPFPEPDRLVVPRSVSPTSADHWTVTYGDFQSWEEAGVFEHVAVYQRPALDVSGGAQPLRADVTEVTRDFFAALGTTPSRGRFLTADDFGPSREPAVVISHGLWQRLGGRPDIVGSQLRVSGISATVVGITRPSEQWPVDADLWMARRGTVTADDLAPDNFVYEAVARLKPETTPEAVRARLGLLAADQERAFPAKRQGVTVTILSASEWLVGGELTRSLWILLGAVGFVLLIACVNVANLLLARTTRRQHELALRAALGAGRGRITRQLLAESALLAVPGGVLGILLALAGIRGLLGLAPPGLPGLAGVTLNAPVLAVALGSTLLCVFLAGLAPALHGSAEAPALSLSEGGRRTTGRVAARRLRSTLVVAEVALSLTLLAAAALLIESVRRLEGVAPGLDIANTITFEVAVPTVRMRGEAAELAFWDQYLGRLETLNGVHVVSAASALPLGGGGFYWGRNLIEAGAPEPPVGPEVEVMWNVVTPRYFATLRQPILTGRDFTARDDSLAPKVIIVNQAFANAMFRGKPALGRRVVTWRNERFGREIVGVVGDVRYSGVSDSLRPVAYVPLGQTSTWRLSVMMRGRAAPEALLEGARRELAAMDPEIAMARPRTLHQVRDESIARPRFLALLMGIFAGSALVLAAVGLSGLLWYMVAQRDRELSVRIALGAPRRHVLGIVVGQALALAATGIGLGLIGALALTRILRSLLFGVSPADPAAFAMVAGVLLVIALAASAIPAYRAARADPLATMRGE